MFKWDDQTYYSLKENNEKSHRTLFSCITRFKDELFKDFNDIVNTTVNIPINDIETLVEKPSKFVKTPLNVIKVIKNRIILNL